MDCKKSYRIFWLCLSLSLALILFALLIKVQWIGIVGVVIFFLGLIQAAVFYRCPDCGASFDFRRHIPKYCPQCGKKLESGTGPLSL